MIVHPGLILVGGGAVCLLAIKAVCWTRRRSHLAASSQSAVVPNYGGYNCVVISYKRGSHQDNGNSSDADWLYEKLKAEPGCIPFQDIQNLIKGEQFKVQLAAACQTCSVFVPLLSKGYVHSSYCLQELQWASNAADPFIVPVLFDDPAIPKQRCLARYRGVLEAALKLEAFVVPALGLDPMCADAIVAYIRAHIHSAAWPRWGSGNITVAELTYQHLPQASCPQRVKLSSSSGKCIWSLFRIRK